MKKHVMILVVWILLISIPGFVYAQGGTASGLREAPKEGTRKVVPISRTLINVDLWMNKECGSPFYTEEKVQIFFKTDADGYVTLYDIDVQGNVLVIFPNRYTPDNYVRAGQTLQFPAQQADYDLIVEGPEGIEYIEAMASTDPSYRWNYQRGEPRWLKDLNLKGNKGREYQASNMDQETTVAYKESKEYKTAPKEFGAAGLQSLAKNFQLSTALRDQVRSKLVVRPRESEQPQQRVEPVSTEPVRAEPIDAKSVQDYSTATCYMYIVNRSSQPSPPQTPPQAPPSQQGYLGQLEGEFRQIPGIATQLQRDRLMTELSGHSLFKSGSSSLYNEAARDLSKIASILMRYPDTTIIVMGHTDSVGDNSYNQRLSEARAKAVASNLVSQGVAPQRMRWIGYGESMPIDSNATDAGRQRNRRVELEIRYGQ